MASEAWAMASDGAASCRWQAARLECRMAASWSCAACERGRLASASV